MRALPAASTTCHDACHARHAAWQGRWARPVSCTRRHHCHPEGQQRGQHHDHPACNGAARRRRGLVRASGAGAREAVVLDLDSGLMDLSPLIATVAWHAAKSLWPDNVVGSSRLYVPNVRGVLPVLADRSDAVVLVRLLADEGIIGARSTAGREGPVVGRPVRRSGSRPLLIAEISEHWPAVMDSCLLRWSLERGCSRDTLLAESRDAYCRAQETLLCGGGSGGEASGPAPASSSGGNNGSSSGGEAGDGRLLGHASGSSTRSGASRGGSTGSGDESGSGDDSGSRDRGAEEGDAVASAAAYCFGAVSPFPTVVEAIKACPLPVCIVSDLPPAAAAAILRQCGLNEVQLQPGDDVAGAAAGTGGACDVAAGSGSGSREGGLTGPAWPTSAIQSQPQGWGGSGAGSNDLRGSGGAGAPGQGAAQRQPLQGGPRVTAAQGVAGWPPVFVAAPATTHRLIRAGSWLGGLEAAARALSTADGAAAAPSPLSAGMQTGGSQTTVPGSSAAAAAARDGDGGVAPWADASVSDGGREGLTLHAVTGNLARTEQVATMREHWRDRRRRQQGDASGADSGTAAPAEPGGPGGAAGPGPASAGPGTGAVAVGDGDGGRERGREKGRGGGEGQELPAGVSLHLAEWSCTSVSLRARGLAHPGVSLLADHQLAELLKVTDQRLVMDGIAWS